jgi:hypothetical protein
MVRVSDERPKPEADVLEQKVAVVPEDDDPAEAEVTEADPADVMEQQRAVPYDDDEGAHDA